MLPVKPPAGGQLRLLDRPSDMSCQAPGQAPWHSWLPGASYHPLLHLCMRVVCATHSQDPFISLTVGLYSPLRHQPLTARAQEHHCGNQRDFSGWGKGALDTDMGSGMGTAWWDLCGQPMTPGAW